MSNTVDTTHITQTFEQYTQLLLEQSKKPIHNDQVIGAYSSAMYEFTAQKDVQELFINDYLPTLQRRRILTPWLLNNLVFRSVNNWLIHPPCDVDIDYASQAFNDPQTFTPLLPKIFGVDGHQSDGRVLSSILFRNVQSNKSERYKTMLLLGLLFPKDFSSVSMLDVGCSQNQGLKQLALGEPFEQVQVQGTGFNTTTVQKRINAELLAPTFNLKKSYGTDIWTTEDKENQEWVKACSLIPSELRKPELVSAYDRLESAQPSNVSFVSADFANLKSKISAKKVDVVSLFTVLYEVPPSERPAMFQNALMHSKRFVLVMDAAKKITDSLYDSPILQLQFGASMFNEQFGYKLFMYDKQQPHQGMQELMQWSTGRCKIAKLVGNSAIAAQSL